VKSNQINSNGLGLLIEGDENTNEMVKIVRKGMGCNVRLVGESGEGKVQMEMGKNFKVSCEEDGIIFMGRDDAPEDNNINERIGSDNFVLQVTDGSIYSGGDMMVGEGKSFSSYNTKLGNNAAILRTGCVSSSIGNQVGFIWEGEQLHAVPFNDGNILTRKKVQVKNFTIDHPTKSENYLVHACLEGATADVFYRGNAVIRAGEEFADVDLPEYYEELVEENTSTLLLTPIGIPFFRLGGEIKEKKLRIYLDKIYNKDCRFSWEVKGQRRNTDFEMEPRKDEVKVERWGPYTFIE